MSRKVRLILVSLGVGLWMNKLSLAAPVEAQTTSAETNLNCQLRIDTPTPYTTLSSIKYFIDVTRVANTTDYRLDTGDGSVFDNNSGNFVYTYGKAGTYSPLAYVKDVEGSQWSRCSSLTIQVQQADSRILGVVTTPTPTVATPTATSIPVTITTQPNTGGRGIVTVGLIIAAIVGLGLFLIAKVRGQ